MKAGRQAMAHGISGGKQVIKKIPTQVIAVEFLFYQI